MFSSGGHLVYWSGTILAIVVWSHIGNIPVKFELHWPRGKKWIAVKANHSHFSIFRPFCTSEQNRLAILEEGHLSNILMKFD